MATMFACWHCLPALLTHSGSTSPEGDTAATVLLPLLGVIATWLLRPGEHPLASKLLRFVRSFLLVDVVCILIGTGFLVLHGSRSNGSWGLWLVLFICSAAAWVVVILSWLMPATPFWRRTRGLYSLDKGTLRMGEGGGQLARTRKGHGSTGTIRIPSPDGYHYADDHPWTQQDQQALIDLLTRVRTNRATAKAKQVAPKEDSSGIADQGQSPAEAALQPGYKPGSGTG
jgi:hypothetical protein